MNSINLTLPSTNTTSRKPKIPSPNSPNKSLNKKHSMKKLVEFTRMPTRRELRLSRYLLLLERTSRKHLLRWVLSPPENSKTSLLPWNNTKLKLRSLNPKSRNWRETTSLLIYKKSYPNRRRKLQSLLSKSLSRAVPPLVEKRIHPKSLFKSLKKERRLPTSSQSLMQKMINLLLKLLMVRPISTAGRY